MASYGFDVVYFQHGGVNMASICLFTSVGGASVNCADYDLPVDMLFHANADLAVAYALAHAFRRVVALAPAIERMVLFDIVSKMRH